jgi:hypothetical protein
MKEKEKKLKIKHEKGSTCIHSNLILFISAYLVLRLAPANKLRTQNEQLKYNQLNKL